MENNDNKQKKTFHYVLLVTFLIIILIGLVCVLFVFGNNLKAQNDYNSVKSSVEATTAQIQTSGASYENSDTDLAENPIDFDALANTNDEIYAWITIPNTNIDYPVLQSKTSDLFYIDHDVNKNYLFAGSIYSEFSNLRNFSDRDTVLYGHNMLDGSMFADLHKFEDEDFFNENKYIYIYQKNRKLTYEIVSAYNYDSRHIMNSFNFADDNVFQEYINDVMNPHSDVRNVNSDVELNLDSKLLTLSTCLNGNNDGRFLVQGVLIKDEPTY
ncbi:MAG: class B sortase [Ruminococcus bromii]|nr:class B sortase [Ruminococcus bromii]